MGKLQNKTALITGGASGIGRAAATLFVTEGARVVIVDRDETLLKQVVKEVNSLNIAYFVADIRQKDAISAYTNFALGNLGPIDAALLNAGICGANMSLEEYPEDLFDEVLAVNLKAAWLGLRAVVPGMKARKRGSIVLTSSIQGLAALPGTTAYTTSKHALVGITRQLSWELAPHGITVNSVAPGVVISNPSTQKQWESYGPDGQKRLVENTHTKRLGKPEDIANAVLFLASEQASWITGQIMSVDGGRS